MICPICQKEFEPKKVGQKYCSYWCKRENAKKRAKLRPSNYVPVEHLEIHCKFCGKVFVQRTKKHIFCEPKCYEAFRRQTQERNKKMRGYQKEYRRKLKVEKETGIPLIDRVMPKPVKTISLTERIREAKRAGYSSYAEYQKAKTLQRMRCGK